ncbi:MAG: branched-chain amino acid transport system II carrier protein [Alphaproteobacteria bacterium]|nr:branched-chain amino acid transport system II carrier protein [Alphaproteobacteria bacterium]
MQQHSKNFSAKMVLTAGFAMFSMFFGSGNLVFPLIIGSKTLGHYSYAIVGLIITAVFVPFLGLLGMIQFEGDRKAYFSSLGKIVSFSLILLMLSLMGPFGIIPRCITVAFGGIQVVAPSLSYVAFSLFFCVLIGALIWKKNKIVSIIGLVLTPFKLGSIILLIVIGLWFNDLPIPLESSTENAFLMGFSYGYQTMDLMAAFFFACTICDYLRMRYQAEQNGFLINSQQLFKMAIAASLIGALLLSVVYVGFVMLGAKYAPYLHGVPPESMLAEIAKHALGHYATPVIAMVLAVSCLATATVVATLFADFLTDDISSNRLSRPQSIVLTLVTTFGMSLLGFQTICSWLGAILSWIYPLLVVYAIMQIIRKLRMPRLVNC